MLQNASKCFKTLVSHQSWAGRPSADPRQTLGRHHSFGPPEPLKCFKTLQNASKRLFPISPGPGMGMDINDSLMLENAWFAQRRGMNIPLMLQNTPWAGVGRTARMHCRSLNNHNNISPALLLLSFCMDCMDCMDWERPRIIEKETF